MLTHRTVIRFTGVIWMLIGIMLTSKGVQLKPSWIIVVLAGSIGCFKGCFVLQKTAMRISTRIMSLPLPLSLKTIYPPLYWLLMLSMMSLGMLLNVLHTPPTLRALIDIAVGYALFLGAVQFFRFTYDRVSPLQSPELDKPAPRE